MIEVNNLIFGYKVGGFSLEVGELGVTAGEKVAVIGPSGRGKTTQLHQQAGVLAPSAGRNAVDGTEVSALDREDRQDYRALRMGMVFQEFELLAYLNLIDNVLLPYRISPVMRRGSGRMRWCGRWGWTASSRAIPATSPRASGNGSRSAAPWSPGRRSSSATNPPATSTRTTAIT